MKGSNLNEMADEFGQVAINWLVFGTYAIALFMAVRWGLGAAGVAVPIRGMLGCWYGIGLACALYWPLRNWKDMRGHWRGYLPEIACLGLFGPLAFVMGYPI